MKNNSFDRPHILIAEDDPSIGNLLQYLLQRRGFRTTAVADGRVALDTMFALTPDLLLLDLMLPTLHGFEVCRLLKSAPVLQRTPVVMLTALASEADRRKWFQVGADDYLTKPFHNRDLINRVERLLGLETEDAVSNPPLPIIVVDGRTYRIDLEAGALRPVDGRGKCILFESLNDETVQRLAEKVLATRWAS